MKQKSLEHLFKMRRKTYHKAEEESSGEKWRRNHFFFTRTNYIFRLSLQGRSNTLSLISFWETHGEGGAGPPDEGSMFSVPFSGDKKCLAFFWGSLGKARTIR